LLVYGDKGQKNISKEFGYRIEQRDRQHRYGLINMFLTLVCHCKVGALGVSDASVLFGAQNWPGGLQPR
jgi:hypothetical protein